MTDLECLHSVDYSAESLWYMYKNAKNLLPYRRRMENLIWRMMFVKTRKRLSKDASQTNLQLSSFIQTPFLGHAVESIPSAEKTNEDFNYVAHIRQMSEAVTNNVPNRKRPAPISPFMTHEADHDTFNGIVKPSIHSNLSAAFKGKSPDHVDNENHGYSFQLDSFTLEGPSQSDFSQSHQEPSFSHQYFGAQSLSSTSPGIPTSALQGKTSFAPTAGTYGSEVNLSGNHSSHFIQQNSLFSGVPSTAPHAIGVPQNSHFLINKRKTPMSSYDPSSFVYPAGPSSFLSDSVLKHENSLVSVSDHFASGSRPYTPYEFDEQTSLADSYFPGIANKEILPSDTPHRGSLAGPRVYDELDSKLTFFDNNGQGNSSSMFKQKQKLPYQNFPEERKERTTNFWIDDYFNESSSPHGSVSTSASGTNSGLNRVTSAPAPKKKGKKPKSKKTTKSDNPAVSMEEYTPLGDMKSEGRLSLSKQNSKKNVATPSSKTPTINGNIECTNCFTKTTPLWRRNPQGEPLCNACGLFLKLHGTVRPLSLKTDVIKKRQRGQSSGQNARKASTAGGYAASTSRGAKSERDGDDLSPAPVGKSNAGISGKSQAQQSQQYLINTQSQASQPPQPPKEVVDASGANSAGNFSPHTDVLHSINELVKDEWGPGEQGDTAMFDATMTENKSQWDWLSMNI